MNKYNLQRAAKDDFFEFDPQSPLTPEQKTNFEGLYYFPVDEALRFEIEIERFEDPQEIRMQTSTGHLREFVRYGQLHFTVDGQDLTLTIYANQHGYFLPFVDAQAGKETYGAGRYLDPEVTEEGRLVLDFNLAYNPYCAYNDRDSCPLPPAENRLPVAIKAGEKNFK
ncbi:MAG: DUF1684 domain-containing protein [Anaerolineales bacterium]|nr:DUF1684 domain-containing protein [Anaerolineales bacterium]